MTRIGAVSPPQEPADIFCGPTHNPWSTTMATAPVANTAYLYKFRVGAPIKVSRVMITTGVATDHVDVGIYNLQGVRLASTGDTALVGSPAQQTINLTAAVTLAPGLYWAAIAINGTTGRVYGVSTLSAHNAVLRDNGYSTAVANSFVLPNPIIPGATSTAGFGCAAIWFLA